MGMEGVLHDIYGFVPKKICKIFQIPCHIELEFCGICMKH